MPSLPAFSDEEMDVLATLAAAVPPPSRDRFLRLVANRLSGYPPELRGPGLVHRIGAEAQRGSPTSPSAAGNTGDDKEAEEEAH